MYAIITDKDPSVVSSKVNELLSKGGWLLFGHLTFYDNKYCQVVHKPQKQ